MRSFNIGFVVDSTRKGIEKMKKQQEQDKSKKPDNIDIEKQIIEDEEKPLVYPTDDDIVEVTSTTDYYMQRVCGRDYSWKLGAAVMLGCFWLVVYLEYLRLSIQEDPENN